jgi:hypothetical protein
VIRRQNEALNICYVEREALTMAHVGLRVPDDLLKTIDADGRGRTTVILEALRWYHGVHQTPPAFQTMNGAATRKSDVTSQKRLARGSRGGSMQDLPRGGTIVHYPLCKCDLCQPPDDTAKALRAYYITRAGGFKRKPPPVAG